MASTRLEHLGQEREVRAAESAREGGRETGRVEAFSDGVFAVAITLLALDLRIPNDSPEASGAAVLSELVALWPQYLAFLVSFTFIGIMWINHHRLFTHIAHVDTPLMLFNLLLLMGVTAVPFATSLLADHLGHPAATVTTVVYSGLFFVIAIFFNVLWRYAAMGGRLLGPQADVTAADRITRQYMFGPLLYLAACVLAFVSVPLSLLVNLLLALFFALPAPSVGTRRP